MRFDTNAVRTGEEPNFSEGGSGDVAVPIHIASTFARRRADAPTGGYEYSRTGNPTRAALEKRLAVLEGGAGSIACASGLAAEANILFLLQKGDKVLVCDDLYGGTYRLFEQAFVRFGLQFEYLDMRSVDEVQARAGSAKMIWLETPTNPLLRLYDIREIASAAHGANPDAIVVVDNTFASPYFQQPLKLGADAVVHSTTKYVGGHSDMVGGAVIAKEQPVLERLKFFQNAVGAVASPFDCFLALRGLKTLHARMERHQENALAVAEFLSFHQKVKKVHYPGLQSHPQHELAKKQMSGFSGMVSLELENEEQALRLAESTRLFLLAESLGGVESLISHPASMTHASIPKEGRRRSGLSDALVRLSVGIEAKEDLLEDLGSALDALP